MNAPVTVEISTKDRYESTLPLALLSVAQQTVPPQKLLLFDDGAQQDLRQNPTFLSLFHLLTSKGINWEVAFGERKGQVANHQKAIDRATTPLIWRLDDDDAPDANALEKLLKHMDDPQIGAVSGLVHVPSQHILSRQACSGDIADLWSLGNMQWSNLDELAEVDHLHNSFLFRKDAAHHGYCMALSPVGHGEETLFTYGIKQNGYRLLVDPSVKIWHLRAPQGGIRSYPDSSMWAHDQAITDSILHGSGVKPSKNKLIVLNNGIGDHFAFKSVFPAIREKYADHKLFLAVTFPAIFADDDVELLSIADAIMLEPNMDRHDIYKWMWDNNWQTQLNKAFLRMHGL